MNDFLSNLLVKSLSSGAAIQPRLPSLFEPPRASGTASTFSFMPQTREPSGEPKFENPVSVKGPSESWPQEVRTKLPDSELHPPPASRAMRSKQPLPSTQPAVFKRSSRPLAKITISQFDQNKSASAPEEVQSDSPRMSKLRLSPKTVQPSLQRALTHSDFDQQTAGQASSSDEAGTATPRCIDQPEPSARPALQPVEIKRGVSPREAQVQDMATSELSMVHPKRPSQPVGVPVQPQQAQEVNPIAHYFEKPELAPTIRVTIGRIEVRAVMPQAPSLRQRVTPAPKLTLDDYLRSRNGGRR